MIVFSPLDMNGFISSSDPLRLSGSSPLATYHTCLCVDTRFSGKTSPRLESNVWSRTRGREDLTIFRRDTDSFLISFPLFDSLVSGRFEAGERRIPPKPASGLK